MRRLAALMVAGFMVLSTFAVGSFMPVTHASEVWCEDDPPITVNGVTVQINVGVPSTAVGSVTVQVQVAVPAHTPLPTDSSGTAVFQNNKNVTGTVNVTFVPQSSAASGHSNNQVTVTATVFSRIARRLGHGSSALRIGLISF